MLRILAPFSINGIQRLIRAAGALQFKSMVCPISEKENSIEGAIRAVPALLMSHRTEGLCFFNKSEKDNRSSSFVRSLQTGVIRSPNSCCNERRRCWFRPTTHISSSVSFCSSLTNACPIPPEAPVTIAIRFIVTFPPSAA